jgi:hypothetical protein
MGEECDLDRYEKDAKDFTIFPFAALRRCVDAFSV